VAQLNKADASCAEAYAARLVRGSVTQPRAFTSYASSPNLTNLSFFCAGTAPTPVGRAAGRDEMPTAQSVPTKLPDVESGSATQGFRGSSKDKSAKRVSSEEEGRGGW
jgi:hypothetical protein